MKKIIFILVIVSLLFAVACKKDEAKDEAKEASKKANTDPSYAFGVAIGSNLKDYAMKIDFKSFEKGMKESMGKDGAKMTLEEAGQIIQLAIADAGQKKGEANLAEETAFLEKNGKKKGIITTASGLQYEVIKEGTGASPKDTDSVKVDYVGTLLDGSTFDSSIKRGQPAEFPLAGVIPGWTEGIQLMKVGGKTKFYIPSKLAYGPSGAGGQIGSNATLIFEVDLLEILAEPKK